MLQVVPLPPKIFSRSVKLSASLSGIYSIFSKRISLNHMIDKSKGKTSKERFIVAAICWKVETVLFFNILQLLICLLQDFPLFSESHRKKMSLQYKLLKSISMYHETLNSVCVLVFRLHQNRKSV